jgi:hypothetical protein
MEKDTIKISDALIGKMSYSDKLKHPKWQKKRLEIMDRDKFCCKLCNDSETTLNVHHLEYGEGDPWEIENDKLITICEHCHFEMDSNKNMPKIVKLTNGIDRLMLILDEVNLTIKTYDANDCLKTNISIANDCFDKIIKFIS